MHLSVKKSFFYCTNKTELNVRWTITVKIHIKKQFKAINFAQTFMVNWTEEISFLFVAVFSKRSRMNIKVSLYVKGKEKGDRIYIIKCKSNKFNFLSFTRNDFASFSVLYVISSVSYGWKMHKMSYFIAGNWVGGSYVLWIGEWVVDVMGVFCKFKLVFYWIL